MKIAIVASLIASAAAFAPAKHATTNTALSAFENELGAQKPLGFYDPLNLVADGDEEKFERLRYTELVRDLIVCFHCCLVIACRTYIFTCS